MFARAPYYIRLQPCHGGFNELRLLNIHIYFGKNTIPEIEKRKIEFDTLVQEIYPRINRERYGNFRSAYTIAMGDYNLNIVRPGLSISPEISQASLNEVYGHTGVCHGHYFMENYAGAKQDFAIRSGLIQKERLFTPEQMIGIYRCCADSVDGDFFELTGEQEKMIRSVQQQIEECVPDLDERIRQQEDALEQIAQEQTM